MIPFGGILVLNFGAAFGAAYLRFVFVLRLVLPFYCAFWRCNSVVPFCVAFRRCL